MGNKLIYPYDDDIYMELLFKFFDELDIMYYLKSQREKNENVSVAQTLAFLFFSEDPRRIRKTEYGFSKNYLKTKKENDKHGKQENECISS